MHGFDVKYFTYTTEMWNCGIFSLIPSYDNLQDTKSFAFKSWTIILDK